MSPEACAAVAIPRSTRLTGAGAVLAAALAGCGDGAAPADAHAGDAPQVIAGVTSDFVPGKDLDRLRAVTSIDGVVAHDETISIRDATPLAFTLESPFPHAPAGARVEIRLEAYAALGDVAPLVTRTAATTVVDGRTLLLRARLERECVPGYRIEGDRNTPECEAPETCVAAACRDPYVAPEELEAFAPGWASAYADACRPLDAGAPVVSIGRGIDAYAPLEDGDAVPIEAGPQGGYHMWLALRMTNLHQAGSVTELSADGGGIDPALAEIDVPYGYDDAGGGWCELHGVRYQLFFADQDVAAHIGSAIHLSARVVDATGDVGFGERTVIIAPP